MASKNTANQSAQQIADTSINSVMFPFEYARTQAIRQSNEKTDELVKQMRRLAAELTRRADAIADRSHTPNRLGEVQDAGREIDRLCEQVHAAIDSANLAARLADEARKALIRK